MNPGWIAVTVALAGILFWTGFTYREVGQLRIDVQDVRLLLAHAQAQRLVDDKEARVSAERQRDRVRDIEQAMAAYLGRPYIQRHAEDRPADVRVIATFPPREPVPPTEVG